MQTNHVRVCVSKCIGEIEKFLGIAREARKFAKDEARDVLRTNVGKHSLRFGMIHNSFAAYSF